MSGVRETIVHSGATYASSIVFACRYFDHADHVTPLTARQRRAAAAKRERFRDSSLRSRRTRRRVSDRLTITAASQDKQLAEHLAACEVVLTAEQMQALNEGWLD